MIDKIKTSGISPNDLADKTGIALERIYQILAGQGSPKLSEARNIAKVLKLPLDFLLNNKKSMATTNLLFRKAYQSDEEKLRADRISFLIDKISPFISDYTKLTFDQYFPTGDNSFENARFLATKVRQIFCNSDFYSPLLELPQIISNDMKCVLAVADLGLKIDGASAIVDNVPYIFISPRFKPRMLFTLAHELGHIISHHNQGEDYINIDANLNELRRDRFRDENFANAFASELLMPEEGVGSTLQSIRRHLLTDGIIKDIEIIYLSRVYSVSFEAAAKRCEDLDLIPAGGAFSLSEQIKTDYGSAEKRAEGFNIPDRPTLVFPKISPFILESAIKQINNGSLSIEVVAEKLGVSLSDIMDYNSKAV